MWASQELYESVDDTTFDNALNGRVPFLGQELAELGGAVELQLRVVGEDAVDHDGKLLGELGVERCGYALVIVRIAVGGLKSQVPPLGRAFLALGLANLNLLLFTATSKLVGLEEAFALECIAPTCCSSLEGTSRSTQNIDTQHRRQRASKQHVHPY